jgi:hypothetical protein
MVGINLLSKAAPQLLNAGVDALSSMRGGKSGNVLGNLNSTASQANGLLDATQAQTEMQLGLQKKSMEIQFFAKAMAMVQDTAKACMNAVMK